MPLSLEKRWDSLHKKFRIVSLRWSDDLFSLEFEFVKIGWVQSWHDGNETAERDGQHSPHRATQSEIQKAGAKGGGSYLPGVNDLKLLCLGPVTWQCETEQTVNSLAGQLSRALLPRGHYRRMQLSDLSENFLCVVDGGCDGLKENVLRKEQHY